MLKKPIQDHQLAKLLNAHYGIDIHTVELVLGGADMNALAYKADSESNSYCVKLKYSYYDEINLSIYMNNIKEINANQVPVSEPI